MKKKFGFAGLGLVLSVAIAFGALASVATAKPKPPPTSTVTVPITGVVTDTTSNTGLPVAGTFTIDKFAKSNGQLVAVGSFDGTVGSLTATDQPLTLPVSQPSVAAAQAGSCEILDLVLGPLDLNLLGLEVHLDQVHLNITAQQGPGNLLGNLLCAVAGLLDNTGGGGVGGALNGIVSLLNQILGVLNGLQI